MKHLYRILVHPYIENKRDLQTLYSPQDSTYTSTKCHILISKIHRSSYTAAAYYRGGGALLRLEALGRPGSATSGSYATIASLHKVPIGRPDREQANKRKFLFDPNLMGDVYVLQAGVDRRRRMPPLAYARSLLSIRRRLDSIAILSLLHRRYLFCMGMSAGWFCV